MSPFWTITGVVLLNLARVKSRPSVRRSEVWTKERLAKIAFLGFLYAHALLLGSRGLLFSVTTAAVLSSWLTKGRWPGVAKVLGLLALIGSGMLLIVGYRSVLHLGERTSDVPDPAGALFAVLDLDPKHVETRTGGVEFLYHAGVIEAVNQERRLHWGLNWLHRVTVNVVPRLLWPSKPYNFDTGGVSREDVQSIIGFTLGGGSAPGLVADMYWQFGPGCIGAFFVLGWTSGWLYRGALALRSPVITAAYIMWYCLSANMFTQLFQDILAPFVYSLAPVLLYGALKFPQSGPRARSTDPLKARVWKVPA
jgi:hypothetical protein